MAVLELEQQVQVLEEETEKMVQRMVQMEERLSAEVRCLNVGVSQIGTAVRAVEYALWDLDEVKARISALDDVVEGGSQPLQELSVRVENLQWRQDISADVCVCQDRVSNFEQWGAELTAR